DSGHRVAVEETRDWGLHHGSQRARNTRDLSPRLHPERRRRPRGRRAGADRGQPARSRDLSGREVPAVVFRKQPMAQDARIVLQQRLSQQLVMTPQLRQAIKILQVSRAELETLIDQELTENPVLEENADEKLEGAAEV